MSQLLSFRQQGEQEPALLALHGLYGYGRNLSGIARGLGGRRVILPDLRNHGASFHSPDWDYQVMAEDVARLAEDLGLRDFCLLGHSMGGKVAMQYALDQAACGYPPLKGLVLVDIAPKPYDAEYHRGLLAALAGLDLSSLSSREDADQALSATIPEAGVRSFLLSNLQRSEQGWRWQLNLEVLQARIELITADLARDGAPFMACPVLFLAGAESDYLKPEDRPAIEALFPQARIEWIAGAGHWVHVDQPQALLAKLQSFLSEHVDS